MNKRLFSGYKSNYVWSPYNEQSKDVFHGENTHSSKISSGFHPSKLVATVAKIHSTLGIKRSTLLTAIGCVATILFIFVASFSIVRANEENIRLEQQRVASINFKTASTDTASTEKINEAIETTEMDPSSLVSSAQSSDLLASADTASGDRIFSREDICAIIDSMPIMKESAYAVSVDGVNVVAVRTKDEAESVLPSIVAQFTGGNKDVKYALSEKITVAGVKVNTRDIKTTAEAIEYLLSGSTKEENYVIQEGDTIWSICIEKGISQETIGEANPDLDPETIIAGDTIKLNKVVPFIHMTTTEKAITNEAIPFEDIREETSDLPNGELEILTVGVVGERKVTRELVKVNGEISQSKELKSVLVSEPVTQISRIGVGLPFAGGHSGSFIYPMSGFGVSSVFGDGRAHTGIDMTNPVGSPIYASESGVVTSAGWAGGYGILVTIDHGGSVQTYYAHMSETAVSSGQRVAKGEVVGYVGMTGNTTGPHLHFEIRIGGACQDPLAWL
ncbi:MAG: peptidoglycan DD-metalloendopeptidase family protein [Clostridiales Family XIII bacterium]|jgi:murein DD-endopeptidase MepM/ murein hydrolase activator NlpD|nr:peptidoglycan DD-metalloendopeptidase family protein [Clostridiales Family XIII bacterium]